MVARDPIRKVTLSGATKFDGSKKGADRYGDAHVGSTVHIPEVTDVKPTTARGTASHEVTTSKKG
jgi:hypothetical protein